MAIRTFAAIDVGSFELEMGIYEMSYKTGIRRVDHIRHVIALGKDTYSGGKISYGLVEEMCQVLGEFAQIMKAYRVKDYRAYATSAMREARNNQIILDQIRVRTGLTVRIISNSEQRFISYKAIAAKAGEFNKIIQNMYDKGYVMVSPHDMAVVNEDGTMSRGSIMLPPGKIPFVLSQDDVSYYHYMDGDGFASKLVVDSNGEVKNEYIEDDGSISTGDYDMVPLIDTFVKEHPDFSYHGRKGILAMTGYNGVLGYRTDIAYKTGKKLQDDQKKFLEENPDFDYKQEVKNAKKVAKAMKAEGWEFASHTWGHKDVGATSLDDLKRDDKKWQKYVAPILGKTDMIIFAFGADIGSWEGYSADNEKYEFYKSQGYRYFCNVDSSQYFVQITGDYFRQGRRNLDGYRMYYNPEMLSDLFDVSEVWDSSRPTPVPGM